MTTPLKRAVTADELAQPTVPYDQAVATVVAAFEPLPPRAHALDDALGLVLAEDVIADADVPGFASSAMDGYAVRAADLRGASGDEPIRLRVIGDLPAGARPGIPSAAGAHPNAGALLEPGTCVKIMTGGPVPPGADAIVPWEDTDLATQGTIGIHVEQPPGKHVRPAGEDMRAGQQVLARGTVLRALHLGVLAMLGRTTVLAHPRPRVAVLSTGEELVQPGAPLRDGQVHDSNQTLLAALARAAGATVTTSGSVGDDPAAVGAWLHDAAPHADLIVTSGGASVGEHDWMREVLTRDGELLLWRVAMKPGKPVLFARVDGTPVLGLPGNPGSVYAAAHTFVAPAIRALAGRDPAPRARAARLSASVKGSPSRTMLCRVTLDGDLDGGREDGDLDGGREDGLDGGREDGLDGGLKGDLATPLPAQSSVVLSNLLPAHGYAIVPPGGLPAGAEVRVELFD